MFEKIAKYPLGEDRKRDFQLYLLAFVLILGFGLFFQFKAGFFRADCYVTTLLAFSYRKSGFIRRGLVGTIFDLICQIIPSAFSYQGAIWFMWVINIFYFVSLLLFIRWIFNRIKDDKVYRGAYWFSMICMTFMVPTVCYWGGALGRADIIQITLCVLQIYLIVEEKAVWLTVPLTAINTLFHEGYVLMTFSAVLIVLLYRCMHADKQKAKYWIVFVLNLISCAAVAVLSLKITGTGNAKENYELAYQASQTLNETGPWGNIHYNLLYMMSGYKPEGGPVSADAFYHQQGKIELPVFLVCFLPVFYLLLKGYFHLFKESGKENLIIHILSLILGPALIGVEYVKYCDYGRYILWLVYYFFTVFLTFTVMGDDKAGKALEKAYGFENWKALCIVALMMPYQPLPTCNFTHLSRFILEHFF